jgi:hypothetical protein
MKLRVTLTKRRFYEAEQIYRCLFTPKRVGVLLNACIANSNAQWSADPERGWVRADERQQRQGESQVTGKSKQNRGKQKANGAKEKTNN